MTVISQIQFESTLIISQIFAVSVIDSKTTRIAIGIVWFILASIILICNQPPRLKSVEGKRR